MLKDLCNIRDRSTSQLNHCLLWLVWCGRVIWWNVIQLSVVNHMSMLIFNAFSFQENSPAKCKPPEGNHKALETEHLRSVNVMHMILQFLPTGLINAPYALLSKERHMLSIHFLCCPGSIKFTEATGALKSMAHSHLTKQLCLMYPAVLQQ